VTATPRASELHAVTIVDRLEQIGAIRDIWNAFYWHRPEADLDFYVAFLGLRPEAQPYIVLLEQRNRPVAMIMARLEDTRLELNFGYKTVLNPKVRAITVVPGGVAGATQSTSQAIVAELTNCLARGYADVVILPTLRRRSELYVAATTHPSFFCRQHTAVFSSRWRLALPGSPEEFRKSLSHKLRQNLRTSENRLRRDLGKRISMREFRHPHEIDELLSELDRIARMTYQRGLGLAFEATGEQRQSVSFALERGCFRAYLLCIDEQGVAFWQGHLYDRTFFLGTPGYDPAYAPYSVGTLLLAEMIEHLCCDHDVDAIDFGAMEGDYKRRFGSESWDESDVLIFAPTTRAITINAARTLILLAGRTAKTVLLKTGLLGRVRREWKRRLVRLQQDQ
jgi:CelD/BcsL family acetyltransferase involved in cellulose biosynthesis